ncbi:hypothetical protein ACO34A_08625 [Rhizobium sp. ACO-34A]|nr:hypothetical protein ACO34A_08625 [Rhizobium sp. ACO-34A]
MARTHELDLQTAEKFARIALSHVEREYPHKPGFVFGSHDDVRSPRETHPVFFGSYDWHSCVHGYWMLARLLNRFADLPSAPEILSLFERRLTTDAVAGEVALFERPEPRGFERPYGWGWLLKLAAELEVMKDSRFADILRPLSRLIAGCFNDFLPLATYPVRVGTHFNTAFAIRLAADYGTAINDQTLVDLLRTTALRWYDEDRDCPAWGEPSGDDFLSPALAEAECMRRLLPVETFVADWLSKFLPRLAERQPTTLFSHASVSDRSDGKIAHLDGLNLSRAWCFRSLANALPVDDPRHAVLQAAADRHLAASLPHVAGDYMGEHWLASFAVLALEA